MEMTRPRMRKRGRLMEWDIDSLTVYVSYNGRLFARCDAPAAATLTEARTRSCNEW